MGSSLVAGPGKWGSVPIWGQTLAHGFLFGAIDGQRWVSPHAGTDPWDRPIKTKKKPAAVAGKQNKRLQSRSGRQHALRSTALQRSETERAKAFGGGLRLGPETPLWFAFIMLYDAFAFFILFCGF
jgi:hypothetical protein